MAHRNDIPQLTRTLVRAAGRSLCATMIPFALSGILAAHAQENGPSREQLDRVLTVLRLQQTAASRACLDAMTQVHATERQVKEHENDTGEHPDLDIAHDVLDSDYQNGAVICGADAERACRETHDTGLVKACSILHHGPS